MGVVPGGSSDPFGDRENTRFPPRKDSKGVKLTESELVTPLWRKLVTHFTERLQQLREKNDIDADDKATAATRAEIRMVKDFLKLDKQKPEPDSHEAGE